MRNVTIHRPMWLRGEGSFGSKMLRSTDNKMCCLGFIARAFGATTDGIMDISSPSGMDYSSLIHELIHSTETWNGKAGYASNPIVSNMMAVNDSIEVKDDKRETQLAEYALKLDINLSFED